jgi:hypothetical protein
LKILKSCKYFLTGIVTSKRTIEKSHFELKGNYFLEIDEQNSYSIWADGKEKTTIEKVKCEENSLVEISINFSTREIRFSIDRNYIGSTKSTIDLRTLAVYPCVQYFIERFLH